MTKYERTFELLEATGLNWSVSKIPLVTAEGLQTESFGLFRSNNNAWMGTVGNQYVPLQNSELAETIIEASEAIGFPAVKGGELRGGRKVYLQCELPPDHIGASAIKRYITALNSHDGTTSIAFGATNQVVICQNTFYMAYKSGDLAKYRHSVTAADRIKQAALDMKSALMQEQVVIDNFKRMCDTKTSQEMIEQFVQTMYVKALNAGGLDAPLSKRKANTIDKFNDAMRIEIETHGNNLWSMFNGVTRYTNHVASKNNLDYVMNGAGYRTNELAYDVLMDFVEKHTVNIYSMS